LSLIAFDVARFPGAKLTSIFNANGWFQTVRGDPQHFTYLGLAENELPARGLRQVTVSGTNYWVPDIAEKQTPNPPN
jgi:hypothetical protein